MHILLFIIFIIPAPAVYAQSTILLNAYAHNDHWHKQPLYTALNHGFNYIEADVILLGKKLIVAHRFPFFKRGRTLEELYLQPLLKHVTENKVKDYPDKNYPITLVIDIKTNANKTYKALVKLLEKYDTMLSVYKDGNITQKYVTIVITGHKPISLIRASKQHMTFVDEDLRAVGKDCKQPIYPIASCKYSKLLKWRGRGPMPVAERKRLLYYVQQAHQQGRKVRLWASPENKAVWNELLNCDVDLINTDEITALHDFLITRLSLMATAD